MDHVRFASLINKSIKQASILIDSIFTSDIFIINCFGKNNVDETSEHKAKTFCDLKIFSCKYSGMI